MSIEAYMKLRLTDKAVYWAPSGYGSNGEPTFATPVEIDCLWDSKIQLFRDADGRETVSQALIHVLDDLADHGLLYHGLLTELTAAQKSDPRKVATAFEVKRFLKTPSPSVAGEYNRRALL